MKCSGKEWDTCRVEKMGHTGCYYAEANELFEDLGYIEETKYMDKTIVECLYKKDSEGVRFYKDKTFEVISGGTKRGITMPLLRAINRKCKELGWIV